MRVYVSGASQEFHRVRLVQRTLEDLGHSITFDWTAMVEESEGMALTEYEASEAAQLDKAGVLSAEALLVLAPKPGTHTVGTWLEMGLAVDRIPIVLSGRVSIWEHLVPDAHRCDTDALAVAIVHGLRWP